MGGGLVFAGLPPNHAESVDVTGAVFKLCVMLALPDPRPLGNGSTGIWYAPRLCLLPGNRPGYLDVGYEAQSRHSVRHQAFMDGITARQDQAVVSDVHDRLALPQGRLFGDTCGLLADAIGYAYEEGRAQLHAPLLCQLRQPAPRLL